MDKVNGCNYAWCMQPTKYEAEAMKRKCFIPTPSAIYRNDEHAFEGNLMFVKDADLQELRCPSKFEKLGSNPNRFSIKKKNLVRSKM